MVIITKRRLVTSIIHAMTAAEAAEEAEAAAAAEISLIRS